VARRLAAVPALAAAAATLAGGVPPARAAASGWRSVVIGRSVEGRPIVAFEAGAPDGRQRTLVVGCVHGDEYAGIAVADRLVDRPPPAGLELWVVPDLNPDGAAAGTRGNARGVDLNRNAPWRWRRLGGVFSSGPHPPSEPETRAAVRLISSLRPDVSIWFHQHLDVVDESGGDVRVERRFATLAGLPLARLPREPGSLVGWEDHAVPSGTAFVVELLPGASSAAATARLARAVVAVSVAERFTAARPSGRR
jgi:protein MpaA